MSYSDTFTALLNALLSAEEAKPAATPSPPPISWQSRQVLQEIPPYGDASDETVSSHRGCLVNKLEMGLQNFNKGFFLDNFFTTPPTDACAFACPGMTAATAGVDWQVYAVAAMADAMRMLGTENNCIDSNRLNSDLRNLDFRLRPLLGATYYLMYSGYHTMGGGTLADQVDWLKSQDSNALAELQGAILKPAFVGMTRISLQDDGGDSALETEWFLYNLWMLLKALGDPDVDASIAGFQDAMGTALPSEIGPKSWWTDYTDWFPPLGGQDVFGDVQDRMKANTTLRDYSLFMPLLCYFLVETPYFALQECNGKAMRPHAAEAAAQ